MPRKFRRRRFRRRRPARRRRRRATKSLVVRGPSVVPDQMFVKMKYRQQVTLADPNGLFAQHAFRGNSIFDPDLTGVGGQPMGHDQWAVLYNSYQVMASKCKVIVTGRDDIAGVNANVGLVASTQSTHTGIFELQEQSYSRSKVLPRSADKQLILSMYMKTGKALGKTGSITQLEDLTAPFNTNPTDQWFWTLGLAGITTGQSYGDCTVEITYYVRLFDKHVLPRS